jgi:putative hemolysin
VAQFTRREDGSWLLDGLMNVHEVEEVLGRDIFPPDERNDYQTLGGFVMMRIGHIPMVANHFEWDGWRFEVVDMDGRRVDKVLAQPITPISNEQETES